MDRVIQFEFENAYSTGWHPCDWSLVECDQINGRTIIDVEDLRTHDDDDGNTGLMLNRGFEWYQCEVKPFDTLCLVSEFSHSGQDEEELTFYKGVVLMDEKYYNTIQLLLFSNLIAPLVDIILDYLFTLSKNDVEAIKHRGIYPPNKLKTRSGQFAIVLDYFAKKIWPY